jgi:copper chaperone NosL
MNRRSVLQTLLAVPLIALAGCGKGPAETGPRLPVPIKAGDECHVCGMLIHGFPGPKAEAYVTGRKLPFKFCSTRDFFAWYLQPETAAVVGAVYVEDMGATDWDHPSYKAFMDARKAWYVVGSDAHGAMGPTLASFRERSAARAFAARHGGRLVSFDAVDLALLNTLNADHDHTGKELPGNSDDPDATR